MSRKVVAVMLRNPDAHPFFQGQILWTGFKPKFIEYQRLNREEYRNIAMDVRQEAHLPARWRHELLLLSTND